MNDSPKLFGAAICLLCGLVSSSLATPTNDLFAGRTILTGTNLTVAGDNFNASNEPGEDTGSGNVLWFDSVWYEWSAPTNGVVHLVLTGGNYYFIPSMRVYRGSAVDSLSPASAMLDGSVPVVAGDVIEIQIASLYYPVWGGGGGDGSFGLSLWLERPQSASSNDFFANRVLISTNTFHFEGSLYQAGNELNEPLVSATATQTLWFRFSAPNPGLLAVSATSPQFNPTVAVFEGNTLGSLIPVAALNGSPLAFNLFAEREYVLQVSSDWVPAGRFALDTRFQSLANDSFTNSYQLVGTSISTVGDNRKASLEAGETLPLPGSAGRTLWYSWAAPVSGRVVISSGACCMNRALALYQGPDFAHLQRITSGQDGLIFMAEEGVVYFIQVDGIAGNTGEFTLSIEASAFQPAPNDAFEQAVFLAGGSVDGVACINGATIQPGEPAHRGAAPCKSLWWTWQPPMNGTAFVGNNGSLATNLTFAVYTGDSVGALTLVGKQTNTSLSFPVAGGTTYRVAVVADPPTRGDVIVHVSNFAGFGGTPSIIVPGNLLLEPSFEGTGLGLAHWQLSTESFGGGYVGEDGGADGTTWIVLVDGVSMWQDFATVPGRDYRVKFAFRPDFGAGASKVRIWWDNREVGLSQTLGGFWNWTNLVVTASNNLSRLKVEVVEGVLGFDGFSVVPSQAPPVIITQPAAASTFAGAAASFLVGVSGSAPMAYQWYSPTGLLTNQNAHSLSLDNVSPTDAGPYFVVITNSFGSVTSLPAMLVVESPTSPMIVLQPYGQKVPTGGYVALSVAVVGTPPIGFQWYWNGDVVPGATNRQFVFSSFDPTNAGTYAVRVTNSAQTVWSLPANLTLDTNVLGGGALWFGNEIPDGGFTRKAPVFDSDGITKLIGESFVAQLYAGPDLPGLRPVSAPRFFQTGFGAGLIDPVAVELPNISPLMTAFVQVRVWQSSKGASYEEARALGSKFGKSDILQMTPGIMPYPPPLWGLQSFALQAGLPQFFAGRIDFAGQQPDGRLSWQLTGNAGYRYVIEKSSGDSIWNPFLVLTNATGTVNFSDFSTNSGISLYRARILE
jgi:hypothetical protein